MILIFGGAFQGKLEFAKTQFPVDTVYDCRDGEAQGAPAPELPPEAFSADVICGLEQFVWNCCGEDPAERVEAKDWMASRRQAWQDRILIIRDVSQGIVPMDARTRAFREMNGRMMLYLASEADEVWRVFCGIGKRIR